jgi:hypothetical protein
MPWRLHCEAFSDNSEDVSQCFPDTGGVISCPTIYGGPACTLVELKAARQSLARLEVFEKPLPKLEIVPDAAPGDDEEENNN